MARSVITVGLMLGCAGAHPASESPPAEPAPTEAPAPEAPPAEAPSAASLPSWDDVPSGHPPGATNPPAPQLLVTPDGRCYKRWVSPMFPPEVRRDQLVPACPGADPRFADCGTEIVCPERAAALREGGG